jgi:hypothetical protein
MFRGSKSHSGPTRVSDTKIVHSMGQMSMDDLRDDTKDVRCDSEDISVYKRSAEASDSDKVVKVTLKVVLGIYILAQG